MGWLMILRIAPGGLDRAYRVKEVVGGDSVQQRSARKGIRP